MGSGIKFDDIGRTLRNLSSRVEAGLRERLADESAQLDRMDARALLRKQEGLLRRLNLLLSGERREPELRPACDWCLARRRRRAEFMAAQTRSDAIYNAYYTGGGIQDLLDSLHEYIAYDMDAAEDVETLTMKVYGDHLHPARFLWEKMNGRLEALARQEADGADGGVLSEKELEPLGWRPVGDDLGREVRTLRAVVAGEIPRDRIGPMLEKLIPDCEQSGWRMEDNLRALMASPPEPDSWEALPSQEALRTSMERVLAGEAFEALRQAADPGSLQPPIGPEAFRELARAFDRAACEELLEPYRRDAEE